MVALLGVRQVTGVCGNAKNQGIRLKILRYFHCGERSPTLRCVGIKVGSSSHVGSHKAISNKPWQSFLFPLCTGSIQQGRPVTTGDGSKGIAQAPGVPLNNNNIAKFASSQSISTPNSAPSSPTLASAPTFPKVGGVSPADSQSQPSPVVPSPVVSGPTVVDSKTQAPAGAKSATSPGDRFGNFKYFTDKLMKNKDVQQSQSDYLIYTENNYMDIKSAKTEFLLTDDDLAKVRKISRASPYSRSNDIIEVAWTKDLQRLAMDRWGSIQSLEREKVYRKYNADQSQANSEPNMLESMKEIFGKDSGAIVMLALSMNVLNASAKGVLWMWTKSPSMFSEFMHSCGDVVNQLILAVGRYKSMRKADAAHPYGYRNYMHISSMFSANSIFFIGFGITMYHAIQCLIFPVPIVDDHFWTYVILAFNFCTDAVSLFFAARHMHGEAKKENISVKQYIKENDDPCSNVVLLEDIAGVLGVTICAASIWLSQHFNNYLIDAMGSFLISIVIGSVSFFIQKQNIDKLLGQALPYEKDIKLFLENDKFVNAVHDVKTLDMGDQSRFKAEIVLDAKLITYDFLQTKLSEDEMLVRLQSIRTVDELDIFHQEFGSFLYEQIVFHIDRLEQEIKKKFPEIRHIDIEPS